MFVSQMEKMIKIVFTSLLILTASGLLEAQSIQDNLAATKISGFYLGHYGTENDLELKFNRVEIQSLGENKVVILSSKFEPIAAEVFISTDSTTHLLAKNENIRLRFMDEFKRINIKLTKDGEIQRFLGIFDYKTPIDSAEKYKVLSENKMTDNHTIGVYAGKTYYKGIEYADTVTIVQHNVTTMKKDLKDIQLGFRITGTGGFIPEIFSRIRTFYATQETIDFENDKYSFKLSGDKNYFNLEPKNKDWRFSGVKI